MNVERPDRGAGTVRVHTIIDNLRSGGAEFLLADFARVAADVGIELSVAALNPIDPPSPAADRLRATGVDFRGLDVTGLIGRRALRRVRKDLARRHPDLVHTHLSAADFLGGLAARSLGIPSVTTIHADWWQADGGRERFKTWLTARVRRHCAERVIAVSESARNAYLAAGWDVPGHVTVVRNGITDRSRPGAGPLIRRELGLGPDEIVITALSKLRPEKNFEASIDAVGLLRDRYRAVRLVIAGDGPHEQAVRRHAADHGDAVVFAGHREDVMDLLDATDILIHPSHFDAFPTTLLEAMAASVPVVATAVGGIPEIVEPGVTGVLVEPPPTAAVFAGAVGPLVEDAALRTRLGRAGRSRYEREFSAAPWARRIRAIYDLVLAGGC